MIEFGEDLVAETMYVLLLRSAANAKQVRSIDGQMIELERGQTIYGRYLFAKMLGLKRGESQRCDRVLHRLCSENDGGLHNKININPLSKCTVVTIKNYDDEIKMHSKTNIEQTSYKRQVNTYKSNKNNESDKNSLGKGKGTGSENKFSQDAPSTSKRTLGNSSKVDGAMQSTGSKRSISAIESIYYKKLADKFMKKHNKGDYTEKEAVAEIVKRTRIWEKHAFIKATTLGIDCYSDLFVDTKERWIIQADFPGPNSIQGFLNESKAKEMQTNEIVDSPYDF